MKSKARSSHHLHPQEHAGGDLKNAQFKNAQFKNASLKNAETKDSDLDMSMKAISEYNKPESVKAEAATLLEPNVSKAQSGDFLLSEPSTMLALMPPSVSPHSSSTPKPERAVFSACPDILLDEAQRIEVWPLPENTSEFCRTDATHLLMFARDIREKSAENLCTLETVVGCELVAYPCDKEGRVASWTHRYICCALNFSLAAQKLRLQIVNDMATLHHIENL